MSRFLFCLSFLLVSSSVSLAQACDTNEVVHLLNLILHTSKHNDFLLASKPESTDKVRVFIFNHDSLSVHSCLDSNFRWKKEMIKSEGVTLKNSDTANEKKCMYVSLPIFSVDHDTCMISVSESDGEWGGYGALYFFERKRGKWRFVKKNVCWVS